MNLGLVIQCWVNHDEDLLDTGWLPRWESAW